jgi:hypothetical protein
MILYSLHCSRDHEFEAWFRNGATYDAQVAAGEVSCPQCADTAVAKSPMSPRIGGGHAAAEERPAAREEVPQADAAVPAAKAVPKAVMDPRLREMARLRAAMLAMKKMVQDNCDYVGPEFANEARRIHHGEADERAIYGEATDEEAEALADEGVEVGRIPWPGDSDA